MDSISKRHKLPEGEDIDRISSLPDVVLCHILSFLPTKYAVGTKILSTRWKSLCNSIPLLDFDDSLLLHPQVGTEDLVRKMRSFLNFVDRVLTLRKISTINIFRLKCDQDHDASRVNSWICATLLLNVRELDLYISMEDFAMLPRDLFTCQTLVVLKLGANFSLSVPIKVCLPNLKMLHLKSIIFQDDDSIQRLIASSLVLEDLVILGCGLNNIRVLNISAPALKSLTIECMLKGEHNTDYCCYEVMVDAPTLKYLKFIDYMANGYTVKGLKSLDKAHIDLQQGYYKCDSLMFPLLEAISNVKVLHLSGGSLRALRFRVHMLPTFFNVTHLELGCDSLFQWQLLPALLGRFPCLEALIFMEGHSYDSFNKGYRWSLDGCLPSCFLFHLKTIEIWNFKWQEEGLKLVKFFLENGMVLDKLTVQTHMTKKEELKLCKKLLTFPRGSKTCKVMFS